MPRKQKTIHYLYKTTCLITGRYYIGMHSTANLEDGYMGSGKRLRYSLRKYGLENHVKEILEFFESRELLIEAEKSSITADMVIDDMCMNMMSGGTGGFVSVEQQKYRSQCASKAFHNRLENDKLFKKSWIEKKKISQKLAYDNGRREKKHFFNWKGKKHSEETKLKIGLNNSEKQMGENNSQFGTLWITNGIENKKIKKDSIIPKGWYYGRKQLKRTTRA